ncbi:energy-coupling factor transporter transmembrane protein EcfT [Thermovorax subterraneus]|nr:energy-coupling factor transporter transmembrane protein EcfT [Thermovorax subterraneus]
MNAIFGQEIKKQNIFFKIDGRIKLISAIMSIAILTTISKEEYLAACLAFYILLLCLTGFPVLNTMRRILLPVLFVGFMSAAVTFANFFSVQQNSSVSGAALFLRAFYAILALSSAIYSMTFREFVYSLWALHVPDTLVNLISFTIRYANILNDELWRMVVARKARGYSGGRNFWHTTSMRVIGRLVAVLFLRAAERSQRVYHAMLSRGYSGDMRLLYTPEKLGIRDFAYGALMTMVPLFFKVAEMGEFSWIMR